MMMLKKKDSDPIRFRAHHLLCTQGFQGYGYDLKFIQKLREIITCLENDPTQILEIVSETDEICENCPNLIENYCIKDQDNNIKEMDIYLINNSSLKENSLITYKNALEIIQHDLNNEIIKNICENCVWADKCLFYINFDKYL